MAPDICTTSHFGRDDVLTTDDTPVYAINGNGTTTMKTTDDSNKPEADIAKPHDPNTSLITPPANVFSPLAVAQPEPYQLLSYGLRLTDPHQQYWWEENGVSMGRLLERAGYPLHTQYKHLLLLHGSVLPWMGPAWPTTATATGDAAQPRTPGAALNYDGAPIEPSLNVTASGLTVRFTIEPVGPAANRPGDQLNQAVGPAAVAAMGAAAGADTRWARQLMAALFVSEAEAAALAGPGGRFAAMGARKPALLVAYDLGRAGGVNMKTYFVPGYKAAATGRRADGIVCDTVRGFAPGGAALAPAVDALEAYLAERGPAETSGLGVEMVAVDCRDPAEGAPRCKIYVRCMSNAFERVRDVYTLGGRKTDAETEEGLRRLRLVWHLLLDEREGVADDRHKEHDGHHNAGLLFGMEVEADKPFPTPKVYVPLWHYCKTDKRMAENLSEIFKMQGWGDIAESYGSDLQHFFPTHDIANSSGTHTCVSYAYTEKKGVYTTLYYSPRSYGA
ncbi:tryptophan dimethylallyltransferase-domain-containing protein [Lineolata rhizophorae]|uniref:Tryptophan dimethylallyltransferase-domain-containing protein n=1 Tax=Lineolata rhizophorae TaxID=578093 RepID=A0A6A6PDB4_9PEZI|nr:tryptophan dimethylallyltransferase-domain-containing protein [Lineolata rhizophorae]